MPIAPSYQSEALICAEAENLALALWIGMPSVDDVRACIEMGERGKDKWAGETLFVNSIPPRRKGDPPVRADFSAPVRSELTEFAKHDDIHLLGTAHLVMVDGFLGAAVRTFLNTITLVARPTTPTKVFAELQDSAQWLSDAGGPVTWTPDRIRGTYERALELR